MRLSLSRSEKTPRFAPHGGLASSLIEETIDCEWSGRGGGGVEVGVGLGVGIRIGVRGRGIGQGIKSHRRIVSFLPGGKESM